MGPTRRLTMAQALVEALAVQHIERDGRTQPFFGGMFGIFGHGNVAGVGQALEQAGGRLRYFQARNEQAMVHAATAYAKRSNRLRAFACTSSIGPGATNMLTGAATATVNRLPVLLLPGDVFATRRVTPVLQQLERPDSAAASVNDAFRPLSRYWDRVERPEQLLGALPAAMRVLTSPAETGAVTLALPQDVQAEAFDYPLELFEPRVWSVPRPRPDPTLLGRAADWLATSRRPIAIVGGGVIYGEASAALAAFVRWTGIPVVETQAGKGALPWDHPQNCGPIGPNGGLAANRLARDTDLVLAIGTRLADFTTASMTAFGHPDVRFVGLNVAEHDAGKAGALPLVGDARAGLEELTDALVARDWQVPTEHRERIARCREEWNVEVDRVRSSATRSLMSQGEVIGLVNESAGPDGVVVCAAGGLPGDLLKLWRTTGPGDYHLEYGFSCMGYEIAGGLGVKLASPADEVYVMVGDGSYLMLNAEIATAVQEGLKLVIVVLDNHGFGCIHALSRSTGGDNTFNQFRYREEATGLLSGAQLPIDLVANARSLGAQARRADGREELRSALGEAKRAHTTTVVVTEVDPALVVPSYESWWDVPVAEVSTSERTRAARREYEARRQGERWFG